VTLFKKLMDSEILISHFWWDSGQQTKTTAVVKAFILSGT
jgi:hypothetical protein